MAAMQPPMCVFTQSDFLVSAITRTSLVMDQRGLEETSDGKIETDGFGSGSAVGEPDMTKRILVVDDQYDNKKIMRDLLGTADYETIEAGNGEQAVAMVAQGRPDLILMDIQLPILDGYEATRRIKADPTLQSIPIIAVSSYALSGDEQKARVAGCNDFVSKPFSPRQLLAKIRQYLP
jgi:two-component system, cell cycle response regulator DivK